jgi:predicted esterase
MVFHGNESNPQEHAEYWRPLTEMGWLVALPQSTRAGENPGTYIWNTPGKAEWDFEGVQNQFEEIQQNYPIDPAKTLLGSFSMGGGLAIELTLGWHIPVKGFIAVAPYVPFKYVDPDSNYPDFVKPHSQRGYCIIGVQDSFVVEGTSALAARLPNMGISCQIESHDNVEHEYPAHFEESLQQSSDFLLSS